MTIEGAKLSQDEYQADRHRHGGGHIDRYRNGTNIGRYRPDGTPIPHKGKNAASHTSFRLGAFSGSRGKIKLTPSATYSLGYNGCEMSDADEYREL